MNMAYDPDTTLGGPAASFPTTQRSAIRMAAGEGAIAREALSSVIEVYWKPVYKHVRIHWKRSNEDAKDLVQAFFAALLEQDILAKFDPAKGAFRSYLRGCVDRFVLKQHEFAQRLKRGGAFQPALDFDAAERELACVGTESVEDVFFREWQRQVFTLALEDLRSHCLERGCDVQYAVFAKYDLAEAERPKYAELAGEFGIPVTTVTNYLAFARRELRRLVLERLARVTSGASELRREARAVFGAR